MAPKWRFVVEISGSLNEMGRETAVLRHQTKWSKWDRGRSGVRAPCWLLGCQMSRYPAGYHFCFLTDIKICI